jgi:hypothetical protein
MNSKSVDRYLSWGKRIATLALLALIVGRFIAVGLEEVRGNWNSSAYDQRSYLQLSLKIKERKALTDGKRHPLYPALISPFAEREWAYFTRSKLISLGIGAIGLIVVFLLSRRMYGDDVALLATLLLGINEEFASESARVICESLFVLLFFVTWYYTVKGFSHGHHWIAAGFCAGLAYLTKGTAQTLVISFLISAAIVYRTRLLTKKQILAFLLSYLIAASVLLVYHYRQYGNPFYNYNITHAMWFDSWEGQYISGQEPPTAFTFFKTHSLKDILIRQWTGMAQIIPFLAQALIPVKWQAVYELLISPFGLLAVIGTLAALLYLRGTSPYRDDKERFIFTGVLFVLSYLLFSWGVKVMAAPRFLLTLAPILYLLIADLVCGVVKRRLPIRGRKAALAGRFALYACLALWLSFTSVEAARHIFEDPFQTDRLRNSDGDRVLSWLEEGTEKGTKVIWGPCYSLPNWRYEGELSFKSIPKDLTSWEDFMAFVEEKDARYVILDWETFARREELLSQYFDREGDRITFQSLPPGWALAFAYKGLPCEWCIFKLLDLAPIEQPLQVDLGRRVRLLGYDLDHRTVRPGDIVRLTLYWQALKELDEDYTVFTHLLGEDSTIRGQMDSQPLGGLLPTSTWFAGMIVADRYDIAVAPDASPGEYQIEVGMYLLETMQRLSAVDEGGQRLPDDRVLLEPGITVKGNP